MTDAQQAIEAYIHLTPEPKAMELWSLVEQHCQPPDAVPSPQEPSPEED